MEIYTVKVWSRKVTITTLWGKSVNSKSIKELNIVLVRIWFEKISLSFTCRFLYAKNLPSSLRENVPCRDRLYVRCYSKNNWSIPSKGEFVTSLIKIWFFYSLQYSILEVFQCSIGDSNVDFILSGFTQQASENWKKNH